MAGVREAVDWALIESSRFSSNEELRWDDFRVVMTKVLINSVSIYIRIPTKINHTPGELLKMHG